MTATPDFTDAPPLLTEADVLHRVEWLVGPAEGGRTLWIMWVDGDGRQAPVVMPVDQLPRHPDRRMLGGLASVLGGLRGELATELGPGSVILTVQRPGSSALLATDRAWADALATTCRTGDVVLRGVYLSTRDGVARLG